MNTQTIFSFLILVLVIPLLVLRIKTIYKDEKRIDKAGATTILVVIFSVLITNFGPTLLDIFAIFIFWSIANSISLWTGSYNDLQIFGKPPPSSKKIKTTRTPTRYQDELQSESTHSPVSNVIQTQSIEIRNTGEYTIHTNNHRVVRSQDFSIKVSDVTSFDVLKQSLTPDLDEVLLLGLALLLNWLIITPLTNLTLFNPFMLIYWGGLAFFLYTIRYSYTGPWHFAARMRKIEKELMKGYAVVDFKLIGFVWSFLLIIVGSILGF